MAIQVPTTSEAVTERLQSLLQRARHVKPSTSIEPPLQVSELISGDGELLGPVSVGNEAQSNAVETAAKSIFYAQLGSSAIDDPSFVTIWDLLDILQYCGDRELCPAQLVLLLIEELLDSQSISGCRTVFSFLESRREALIAVINTSKNKDLVILRLCNELLRRLSRAEDPVFCGRVYIFMFQSFPLGDKSSVNLRGNFHVENVTTFEEYLREVAPDDAMQVDDGAPGSVQDSSHTTTDAQEDKATDRAAAKAAGSLAIDTLYPVFWSLQHSFSNPPRLFKEQHFEEFKKGLEATLAQFKEVPKLPQSAESEHKQEASVRSDDDDAFASTFNPKYLTSRDLFELELSDLAFQRHILVQALILIDFLLTLTEKGKNKPYYQNAQKAMQYTFTLREGDTEWALGIKNNIANYLQEGLDGKFYYRMVDTVLSRDKNWVRWKMENCQPFTRDRVATKDFLEAGSGADAERRRLADVASKRSAEFRFVSHRGAGKGVAKLKQAKRWSPPTVEDYSDKFKFKQMDLDFAQSEEEKRELEEGKTSHTWRGLRLASKDRLSALDRLEQGNGLEKLLQSSVEAGEEAASAGPEGRDSVPQERHQSVEEQRADQQSQVTAGNAAA
ncbi:hypothetical protein M011DRAFT_401168 [Sporormia fimetaria CBS 119925]|uniref:Nuclear matrix protein n=1 Tax=Sporormia fimetaria CBS 119925 TaxID=1340428 RepID=A0A6A6VCD7_9PLEO|nr:hypothetical protein M011DRAFT_401168 [Sporormia fimetaria CBS 119925]